MVDKGDGVGVRILIMVCLAAKNVHCAPQYIAHGYTRFYHSVGHFLETNIGLLHTPPVCYRVIIRICGPLLDGPSLVVTQSVTDRFCTAK